MSQASRAPSSDSSYEEGSEEEQEAPPYPIYDYTTLSGSRIRRMRCVPVEDWFPAERHPGVDRRFWTGVQHSFHASYKKKQIKLFPHRRIHWETLNHAAGRDVRSLFDGIPGLVPLLELSLYVEEWVRIFFATVWISPERDQIQFMFRGNKHRLLA